MLINPEGSPFYIFRHYATFFERKKFFKNFNFFPKKIFCAFRALDMAPTLDVPVLFHSIYGNGKFQMMSFSPSNYKKSQERSHQILEVTRHPLSTGIFSATRLLQKKVWRRRGSNPLPSGWETQKNSSTRPGSNPRPRWESNKWSALQSMKWR